MGSGEESGEEYDWGWEVSTFATQVIKHEWRTLAIWATKDEAESWKRRMMVCCPYYLPTDIRVVASELPATYAFVDGRPRALLQEQGIAREQDGVSRGPLPSVAEDDIVLFAPKPDRRQRERRHDFQR